MLKRCPPKCNASSGVPPISCTVLLLLPTMGSWVSESPRDIKQRDRHESLNSLCWSSAVAAIQIPAGDVKQGTAHFFKETLNGLVLLFLK